MRNPDQTLEVTKSPAGAYFFAQIRDQGHIQLGLMMGRIGRDMDLAERVAEHEKAERRKALLIHAGHIAIAS